MGRGNPPLPFSFVAQSAKEFDYGVRSTYDVDHSSHSRSVVSNTARLIRTEPQVVCDDDITSGESRVRSGKIDD